MALGFPLAGVDTRGLGGLFSDPRVIDGLDRTHNTAHCGGLWGQCSWPFLEKESVARLLWAGRAGEVQAVGRVRTGPEHPADQRGPRVSGAVALSTCVSQGLGHSSI